MRANATRPAATAAGGGGSCGGGAAAAPPPDAPCGLARTEVWLPPGVWYEVHTGSLLKRAAPQTTTLGVHLLDVPTYAVGGSVVPRRPLFSSTGEVAVSPGLAGEAYAAVEWTLYPGAAAGSGSMYEDDGETYAYLRGDSATSTLVFAMGGGTSPTLDVNITVAVSAGGAAALPRTRTHSLRLPNTPPPTRVLFNGAPLGKSRFGGPASWHYDGDDVAVVVTLPPSRTTDPARVVATFEPHPPAGLDGLKGLLAASRRAKAALNLRRMAPGEHSSHLDPLGAPLAYVASAPDLLASAAGSPAFAATVAKARLRYAAAAKEIGNLAANVTKDADKLRAMYASEVLEAARAGLAPQQVQVERARARTGRLGL